jgi:S-disulfanyl-L-cysteine oxidoreductase SoxD
MRTTLFVVAAAFLSAAVSHAQAPRPRIWQGVYTAAQAERGRAAYTTSCLRCHNADLSGDRGPALKGERFMTTWGGGGLDRLFAKVRDTMPPFATSTLDGRTKLDIVTFILQTNGFPPAGTELAAASSVDSDRGAERAAGRAEFLACPGRRMRGARRGKRVGADGRVRAGSRHRQRAGVHATRARQRTCGAD